NFKLAKTASSLLRIYLSPTNENAMPSLKTLETASAHSGFANTWLGSHTLSKGRTADGEKT
ncbi:MAG: hypothetical protein RJS98_13860, partial [Rhodospirillaceae bacterium]